MKMNYKSKMDYDNKFRLNIIGLIKEIDKTKEILDDNLSENDLRNEGNLRLKLQELIDSKDLKTDIVCNGNTIIPYNKTIKEYNKHKKSGTLNKLSDYFYKFLHLNCNDIAHYDKSGYIAHYNNEFKWVQFQVINKAHAPYWKRDFQKVLDEIKTY